MVALPASRPRAPYELRGAASQLSDIDADEVVLSGPAGTGKSVGCLLYVHAWLKFIPNARALIVRKTLTSLTASGLVTFRNKILHPDDGVRFFGGNKERPAAYWYPNGSELVVGGMDKPSKVMSTDYDLIYVQEATELVEHEYESLTTRLRAGALPVQQIVSDCNPNAPTHWLKQRADTGRTVMLESRHEDNPMLWDARQGRWTPDGAAYIAKLDALTGVRYLRLRLGRWAAAEGLVYEQWDRGVHLIDRRELPPLWPRDWSVDFGYTNPFVWQQWAEDPDGRLILEHEIYHTQRLVQDHARTIHRTVPDVLPRRIVCDHDAEGRVTLERELSALYGRPLVTTAAYKAISDGIQRVQARLRVQGDGLPRVMLMRDALVERDGHLAEAGLPVCTADEVESYVWDTHGGRRVGEAPIDKDNHGMDALRYEVATLDRRPLAPSLAFDSEGRPL